MTEEISIMVVTSDLEGNCPSHEGEVFTDELIDLLAKAVNEFRAQHNHNDVAVFINGVE